MPVDSRNWREAPPEELAEEVMRLHREGRPPSHIDAMLGLRVRTAHDIVVAEWARDKGANARKPPRRG